MANKLKQESPKGHHQNMGQFYSKLRPADVESLHKLVYVHKDHLANTPFGKHIPAILNATNHAEVKQRIYQADKDVGGAFTANIRGGNLTQADDGTHVVLTRGRKLSIPYSQLQPNGYNPQLGGDHNKWLGQYDYNAPFRDWIMKNPWMHVFGAPAEAIFKEQAAMIPKLKELKEKMKDVAKKQQPLLHRIAVNTANMKQQEKEGGDPKRIQSANALIQQQVDKITKPLIDFLDYRDKVLTLTIITDPAQQKEWIRGYDEIQALNNNWPHETWRDSTGPKRFLPIVDAYTMGRIWGVMYNRAWQYQYDWRSGWEVFVDDVKEALPIALSAFVAPFRLAAMIDPELGFGVDILADMIGIPSLEATLGSPIDLGI
jgi:hypothetical protein